MAVIWNPAIRKSVGIVITNALYKLQVFGFGVCPRTSDSKLVKISVVKESSSMWVVECAYDDEDLDNGLRSNFIISFDLKSDTFGEVCLPERLVYTHYLLLANMNESLVLLEYNDEPSVCGVWMRKDGENKPFTKIYTVKPEGRTGRAGKTGTTTTFLTLQDSNVFYDLKQMPTHNQCSVPLELARREASKFKPGSIPDRPPRRNDPVFAH
nr:DEAD-box ATP-dependent RNA helicase 21 [Tanacetum cinerariifolium]